MIIYTGATMDFLHRGHLNIIKVVRDIKKVFPDSKFIIGLLVDSAVPNYKNRESIFTWEARREILEAIKGVDVVFPLYTVGWYDHLDMFKPDIVIHGDDWMAEKSSLNSVREICSEQLDEWGGIIIDVPYTPGVSTTDIIKRIKEMP